MGRRKNKNFKLDNSTVNMQNKHKPLLFVFLGLLLFGLFIWFLLSIGGTLEEAESKLSNTKTYPAIRALWFEYEHELKTDQEWTNAVRAKLESVNLISSEKADLDTWFPFNEYLNVVIAPDLSNRLSLANQVNTDQELINHIWGCFRKVALANYAKEEKTKDLLMIDVTDKRQANSQFESIANSFRFDLSKIGDLGVSPYLKNREPDFKNNLNKLYKLGFNHQSGSDIKFFIEDFANTGKEKISTLSERYRNVLVILTDGYLETNKTYYTDPAINGGTIPVHPQNQIPVKSSVNLSNWEVIILEVRERKEGKDFDILKDAWTKWLNAMGVKRIEFKKHLDASNMTKNFIESFFNVSGVTTLSTAYTPPKPPSPINNGHATQLLTEAQTTIEQSNDFGKAKTFLRKAAQTEDLADNPKAQELAKEWVKFGDSALEALTKTGDKNMLDIPKHWYELAQIINNTPEIQAKIQACK
jgi:hypothetical protein